MAKDLLIELGSEELPAGFVEKTSASLKDNLTAEFKAADLDFTSVRMLGTPRRTTVIIEGLSEAQEDKVVEVRGPAVSAAYDDAKEPTKALLGFCKSQGVDAKTLKTIKDGKREYVLAVKDVTGQATAALLPAILERSIAKINFKKTMRWGAREIKFARPLHWILALFGGTPVEFTYGHITSGTTTRGHRFLSTNEDIEVSGVDDYESKLKDAYVIVDQAERHKIISEGVKKEAEAASGRLLTDTALVDEVTNLVEYPIVIRGGFDKEFLKLPCDIIVDAMRSHQRYFSVIAKEGGGLLPYFITVANTKVRDEAVVRKGNERVLKARLSDAEFYFEKDTEAPLQDFVAGLKGVVFQAKLGTSYEKVERFTSLALHIGAELKFSSPLEESEAPSDFLRSEHVKEHIARGIIDITTIGDKGEYNKYVIGRAAMLSKADLLSGIVGEFPALQGVIGREYAILSNEAEEVADAILEHYRPVSAKADLPASEVGAIISIADKLDTIAGCFGVGLIPTGASDPYALRRSALGIIAIVLDRGYRLRIDEFTGEALDKLKDKLTRSKEDTQSNIMNFFKERLKNQLLGEDIAHDSIDAVLTTDWHDMVDAVARIKAIEDFKGNPACESLVVSFKRVSNILKDQKIDGEVDKSLIKETEESELYEASQKITPVIDKLRKAGDYKGLFGELAAIKDVIDNFFDKVMVMAEDPAIKENRLRLLNSIRALYIQVADLSRIITDGQ